MLDRAPLPWRTLNPENARIMCGLCAVCPPFVVAPVGNKNVADQLLRRREGGIRTRRHSVVDAERLLLRMNDDRDISNARKRGWGEQQP
jgi:hypothetical protein